MEQLISNTLIAAAQVASQFFQVSFDMETQLMQVGAAVPPESVEVGPIASAFGEGNNKRALQHDRVAWEWELMLRFTTRVTSEIFEENVTLTPITIPRDEPNGIDRQTIIRFLRASYKHPPRGGASNGSEIVYRFAADLCPL